jgi:hypothetical protein
MLVYYLTHRYSYAYTHMISKKKKKKCIRHTYLNTFLCIQVYNYLHLKWGEIGTSLFVLKSRSFWLIQEQILLDICKYSYS